MKKIFSLLTSAIFALGFTACEDVPAPYGIFDEDNGEVVPPTPGEGGVLLEETFETNLGKFENFTTSGEGAWKIDFKTAKASGYDNVNKVNVAGVYYLVSPEFSLEGQTEAHLTYEYIQAYSNKFANGDKVFITDQFDAAKADQNWTEIPVTFKEPNQTAEGKIDWKSFHNMDVQLPAEFMGKKVRISFYHACDEKGSTTMEIKNLKVLTGKAEGGEVNPEPPTPPVPGGVQQLPYTESFSTALGAFKNFTTSGSGSWIIDFHTAKASGYDSANKQNIAGTYYLVSPEISMANQTEVHFSFEYIQAYAKNYPNGNKVFITDNFDENNPTANWTEVNVEFKEPNPTAEGKIDWKTFHKADLQVPANYMGKNIRIAFYHECGDQGSTTMEIKNFNIAAGKIGEDGGSTPDGGSEGDINALNGDFECWVNGIANNWNGEAGNATLEQSNDAKSGKYSILVKGESGRNKRLSYKALDLKAGSYTLKAFLKSETGATARLGYSKTPAESGNDYIYGEYINNIPSTWTEYTYTFDIAADGKYNINIMNGKKPGTDFLVDDVTLTAADGTVIIK